MMTKDTKKMNKIMTYHIECKKIDKNNYDKSEKKLKCS